MQRFSALFSQMLCNSNIKLYHKYCIINKCVPMTFAHRQHPLGIWRWSLLAASFSEEKLYAFSGIAKTQARRIFRENLTNNAFAKCKRSIEVSFWCPVWYNGDISSLQECHKYCIPSTCFYDFLHQLYIPRVLAVLVKLKNNVWVKYVYGFSKSIRTRKWYHVHLRDWMPEAGTKQGQVTTSHIYCGVHFIVPAFDIWALSQCKDRLIYVWRFPC